MLGGERAPNEADLQLFQAGYDETVRGAEAAGYKAPTEEEFATAVSGPRLRAGTQDTPDIYADWFGSLFEPRSVAFDPVVGAGDSGEAQQTVYDPQSAAGGRLQYDPASKTFVPITAGGTPQLMRDYYGYTGG